MWSIFTLHKQRPINLSRQIFQNLYDEILGAWYIPRGGGGVYNWNHHHMRFYTAAREWRYATCKKERVEKRSKYITFLYFIYYLFIIISIITVMKFIVSYHTDTKIRRHWVHNVSSLGTIRWWELKISADHAVNLCPGNKSYCSQISLKPTIQSTLQMIQINEYNQPNEMNERFVARLQWDCTVIVITIKSVGLSSYNSHFSDITCNHTS